MSFTFYRKQYMELFNIKSRSEIVKCGVPQGSILGLLLFLIYVNDISNSTSLKLLSFADDTTISCSSPDINNLYNIVNEELDALNQWFYANKLCLNVKKTKYILFRPSACFPNITNKHLYIDYKPISRVGDTEQEKSFKFLGIYMDETLTWKHHIGKVCSKISHSNYIINKVKHILPKSSLHTLYLTIVQSHLNYGLHIWGSSNSIGKVFVSQKKSLRIINNKTYNSHTEPLFKNSEILHVNDQYKFIVQIFMYQLKHDTLPKSFNSLEYFTHLNRPTTRQHNLANYTRPRTKFTSLLPLHMFPKIWNELGTYYHDITPISRFKRIVRAHYINNYKKIHSM